MAEVSKGTGVTELDHPAGRRLSWRGFVLPAALVAAWWSADALGLTNRAILVEPVRVAEAALGHVASGDLASTVAVSLARFFGGWGLGVSFGIAMGLFLGLSQLGQKVVSPTLNALRQVALFAWIPLFSAWFGNGDVARVAFITMAAMFPISFNLEIACRTTPLRLLEVGRVLELRRWQIIRRIVLPSCYPAFAAGLQLSLMAAWIGTIGAEYLIEGGNGLGVLLSASREFNDMGSVIFAIAVLAGIGLVLDLTSRTVARMAFGVETELERPR